MGTKTNEHRFGKNNLLSGTCKKLGWFIASLEVMRCMASRVAMLVTNRDQ